MWLLIIFSVTYDWLRSLYVYLILFDAVCDETYERYSGEFELVVRGFVCVDSGVVSFSL